MTMTRMLSLKMNLKLEPSGPGSFRAEACTPPVSPVTASLSQKKNSHCQPAVFFKTWFSPINPFSSSLRHKKRNKNTKKETLTIAQITPPQIDALEIDLKENYNR